MVFVSVPVRGSGFGPERAGTLRPILALLGTCLLAALALVTAAPRAAAASQQGIGRLVTPGQTYGGKPKSGDWLGSYVVGGRQVFCVSFELKAPDTAEVYKPGDTLRTKWGDPLPPDVAADISYLLLRYGDTKDPDEAAALAHLLQSWTAPPRPGHDDLDPSLSFAKIAYDAPYHLGKLPQAARQDVDRLTRDAQANRGPWTATVTPPNGRQTVGTTGSWTLSVKGAGGKGVPKVTVTLKLTDATAGGKTSTTVTTGDDGTATVDVTPTGPAPTVDGSLAAPADRPYVREPVNADTQKVVSTGGEKQVSVRGGTKAVTAPGRVTVTKADSRTGTGIPGVALRLTGNDGSTAATGQDGKALTGADGRPTVVTTGDDGTATVSDIRTPQEVCFTEVSPPPGYEQGFDAAHPPRACGQVPAGGTLALRIVDTPNAVPTAVPAGGPPAFTATGVPVRYTEPGALAGLSALALLGSGLVGLIARNRFRRR